MPSVRLVERSILLVLEASTDQWPTAQSKLEAILSTVWFQ